MPAGEIVSYRFALDAARARGDVRTTAKLESIGPPPHDVDEMLVSRQAVERFGGTFRGGLSTGRLILGALSTEEASLADLVRFGAGNRASLEALWPAFSRLDLSDRVPRLDVPVLIVQGTHDRVTPTSLALGWFERLQAPCKRIVRIEDAAHNVPFERPDAFVNAITRHAVALIGRSDPACVPAGQESR